MQILLLFLLFFIGYVEAQPSLALDNQLINQQSQQISFFYTLLPGQNWRNITAEILAQSTTSSDMKEAIKNGRQIILFQYPSDGLQIKALLSFTSLTAHQPLLIVLRGGNQVFGLLHPGSTWLAHKNDVIISSTLRGGVSEGKDEFGGADVHDIYYLMQYLPQLMKEMQIPYSPSAIYMLGLSRGGMEMFLTLSRYPELQKKVDKIVALSSLLNIEEQIKQRPEDMKEMFIKDFGLVEKINSLQWIHFRNPLQTVSSLSPSLPILIMQGTADLRVQTTEAHQMVSLLKQTTHCVNYWEIQGGNHLLTNQPGIKTAVFDWLENSTTC